MARKNLYERDNSIIFKFLDIIVKVGKELYPEMIPHEENICTIAKKMYSDYAPTALERNKDKVKLTPELRTALVDFFGCLTFYKPLRFLFTKAILRGTTKEMTHDVILSKLESDYNIHYTEEMQDDIVGIMADKMTDAELLLATRNIVNSIGITRHHTYHTLYILRYKKAALDVGCINLSIVCRAKCVDIGTRAVVSMGYDKFFNLDEVPETSKEELEKLIDDADEVTSSEKKDGYCIVLTNTSEYGVLIHTNGKFKSEYTTEVRSLIFEKYPNLLDNLAKYYSYIFEYVTPKRKLVVDYGKEESLTLTGIRFIPTGDYVSREVMVDFASRASVPIVKEEKFSSLEKLIARSRQVPADNTLSRSHDTNDTNPPTVKDGVSEARVKSEGWVCKIRKGKNVTMFKVKTAQYLEYSELAITTITPTFIHSLISNGKFDDYIANVPVRARERIMEAYEKVQRVYQIIEEDACKYTERLKVEFPDVNLDLAKEYAKRGETIIDENKEEAFQNYLLIKRFSSNYVCPNIIQAYLLLDKDFSEIFSNQSENVFKKLMWYCTKKLHYDI